MLHGIGYDEVMIDMAYADRSVTGSEAALGAISNELRTINGTLKELIQSIDSLSIYVHGIIEAIEGSKKGPRKRQR